MIELKELHAKQLHSFWASLISEQSYKKTFLDEKVAKPTGFLINYVAYTWFMFKN